MFILVIFSRPSYLARNTLIVIPRSYMVSRSVINVRKNESTGFVKPSFGTSSDSLGLFSLLIRRLHGSTQATEGRLTAWHPWPVGCLLAVKPIKRQALNHGPNSPQCLLERQRPPKSIWEAIFFFYWWVRVRRPQVNSLSIPTVDLATGSPIWRCPRG